MFSHSQKQPITLWKMVDNVSRMSMEMGRLVTIKDIVSLCEKLGKRFDIITSAIEVMTDRMDAITTMIETLKNRMDERKTMSLSDAIRLTDDTSPSTVNDEAQTVTYEGFSFEVASTFQGLQNKQPKQQQQQRGGRKTTTTTTTMTTKKQKTTRTSSSSAGAACTAPIPVEYEYKTRHSAKLPSSTEFVPMNKIEQAVLQESMRLQSVVSPLPSPSPPPPSSPLFLPVVCELPPPTTPLPLWKTKDYPSEMNQLHPRYKQFLIKRQKEIREIILNHPRIPKEEQWVCDGPSSIHHWHLTKEQEQELGDWAQVAYGLPRVDFLTKGSVEQSFTVYLYKSWLSDSCYFLGYVNRELGDPRDCVLIAMKLYDAFQQFMEDEPNLPLFLNI
jgi:hypothetical protein